MDHNEGVGLRIFALEPPDRFQDLVAFFQAALGDAFFEMAVAHRKRFLIETHSDFTIDRFRMRYRDKVAHKPNSQILFFERRKSLNVVSSLPISQEGNMPSDQPDAYRRFFVKEEMRLLGL